MTIEDDYVYVSGINSGLHVIDIRDKNEPEPVGSCQSLIHVIDIVIVGDYAYAARLTNGLNIVDISNKSELQIV